MRLWAPVLAAAISFAAGCGDDRAGPDGSIAIADTPAEGTVQGDLFGEECVQPPFPEIGLCRDGEGACHDEDSGPRCRPFCKKDGMAQCAARQGVEVWTDRGACVCVPP